MKTLKSIILVMLFGVSLSLSSGSWKTDIQKEHERLSKIYVENVRMCKICTLKAERYKKDMRDDELAQATLRNYLRQIKLYCSPLIISSKKLENNSKRR